MNEIRNKRWGECYKRVIVIDSDSNEGVGESAVRISDGAGVQTALMLGENSVGIHGFKAIVLWRRKRVYQEEFSRNPEDWWATRNPSLGQ